MIIVLQFITTKYIHFQRIIVWSLNGFHTNIKFLYYGQIVRDRKLLIIE